MSNTFYADNFGLREFNSVMESVYSTSLGGIQIIPSDFAYKDVQFRFPRSKKKRTRRKWAKRGENFKRVPACYLIDNKYVMHSSFVDQIRKDFKLSPNYNE